MNKNTFNLIITSINSKNNAEGLANILIESKIAACVQVIENVTSIYKWKKKTEKTLEFLLFIKTKYINNNKIKDLIIKNNNYNTPEIISIDFKSLSKGYTEWMKNSIINHDHD